MVVAAVLVAVLAVASALARPAEAWPSSAERRVWLVALTASPAFLLVPTAGVFIVGLVVIAYGVRVATSTTRTRA